MEMTSKSDGWGEGNRRHVAGRLVLVAEWKSVEHPHKCIVCVFVCASFHGVSSGQRRKDRARGRIRGEWDLRWEAEGEREKLSVSSHIKVTQSWNVIGSPLSVLAVYPHKIIQTGCSADNVTVLTTPPFSFCFKLAVKWQECGNVIPTHPRTHADKPRHTQQTPSDVWF